MGAYCGAAVQDAMAIPIGGYLPEARATVQQAALGWCFEGISVTDDRPPINADSEVRSGQDASEQPHDRCTCSLVEAIRGTSSIIRKLVSGASRSIPEDAPFVISTCSHACSAIPCPI